MCQFKNGVADNPETVGNRWLVTYIAYHLKELPNYFLLFIRK